MQQLDPLTTSKSALLEQFKMESNDSERQTKTEKMITYLILVFGILVLGVFTSSFSNNHFSKNNQAIEVLSANSN